MRQQRQQNARDGWNGNAAIVLMIAQQRPTGGYEDHQNHCPRDDEKTWISDGRRRQEVGNDHRRHHQQRDGSAARARLLAALGSALPVSMKRSPRIPDAMYPVLTSPIRKLAIPRAGGHSRARWGRTRLS
jgi:hypothetical protein